MTSFTLIMALTDSSLGIGEIMNKIDQCTAKPHEFLFLAPGALDSPVESNDLRIRKIKMRSQGAASLAAAYNEAAQQAQTDHLIFLQGHCWPATFAFEKLMNYLDDCGGIILFQPMVGKDEHSMEATPGAKFKRGKLKPGWPQINCNLQETSDYSLFQSCGFAISKKDFKVIGGFDKRYRQAPTMECDFSQQAKRKGIPLYLSDAIFYKGTAISGGDQEGINHLIEDCNRYYFKWRKWPKQKLLADLSQRQLISWDQKRQTPISKN